MFCPVTVFLVKPNVYFSSNRDVSVSCQGDCRCKSNLVQRLGCAVSLSSKTTTYNKIKQVQEYILKVEYLFKCTTVRSHRFSNTQIFTQKENLFKAVKHSNLEEYFQAVTHIYSPQRWILRLGCVPAQRWSQITSTIWFIGFFFYAVTLACVRMEGGKLSTCFAQRVVRKNNRFSSSIRPSAWSRWFATDLVTVAFKYGW